MKTSDITKWESDRSQLNVKCTRIASEISKRQAGQAICQEATTNGNSQKMLEQGEKRQGRRVQRANCSAVIVSH